MKRQTILSPSRILLGLALGFALVLALAPSAFAQSAPPSQVNPGPGQAVKPIDVAIDSIQIGVQYLDTKEEVEPYLPGDTLVLAPGERVRLRLLAIPAGRNRSTRYPAARFEVISGSRRVALSRVNETQGSAVLEGVRSDDRGRNTTTLVQYTILQDLNVRRGLMKGTLTIEVRDNASNDGQQGDAYAAESWTAEEMTEVLYQAILLRPMDSGGSGYIRTIEQNGYEGIIEVASRLARSEESQTSVIGREIVVDGKRRSATHEDRVAALYGHLIDLEIEELNPYDYSNVLRRVQGGQYHDVVIALLRSPRFTERFGFGGSANSPTRAPVQRRNYDN